MASRRDFLKTAAFAAGAAGLVGCGRTQQASAAKPNFVVFYADDMGYGDWNRGGHPSIYTPSLNRMADQGVQMTQFYSGNPVCSPSRSALLTGRNAIRTGVIQVFFPGNNRGMSPDEVTIAEALKPAGYTSAAIGKWHLGSTPEYRPLRQGFDYYYGILYSNDMYNADVFRNDERIEHPANQATLTKRYTEEAIGFIEKSKSQPFFLYVPFAMPHVPIFASEKFRGKSRRGLYGDTIEEIDWSVGQINSTLDRLGLSEKTLVIFTSDNGPWVSKNQDGGAPGLLRGAKGDTFEGGMRVPCIARWPGRLPAGQISMEVGSVLDFMPTFCTLAGTQIPAERPIDGINLMPALEGKKMPGRPLFYYRGEHLRAVRQGRWKAHFSYWSDPNVYDEGTPNLSKYWVTSRTPMLFDLEVDPSERFDLAAKHPDVVRDLTTVVKDYTEEVRRKGENQELIDWFLKDWATAPRKGE